MYVRLALLLTLTLCLIPACNKKKKAAAPGAAAGAAGGAATASESRLKQLEQVLSMIPSDSPSVAVVANWSHLLRASDDLQGTLKHVDSGQVLLDRIVGFSASAPVPLPIGEREMTQLGFDPSKPMAVFGAASPVAIFSLKDSAAFQARLATAYGKGKWKDVTVAGFKLRHLSGARQLYCMPMDRRSICSPEAEPLVQVARGRPARSLWQSLTEEERRELARGTALVGCTDPRRLQGRALLRVEEDGLSAQLRLGGPAVGQVSRLLGGKGGGTLLKMAGDAPTAVYLRIQVSAVLNTLRAVLPDPRKLGLDPIRLQASLTGEVLLRETAERQLLAVLGCHDLAVSQSVVDTLAGALKGLTQQGGPEGAAPVKVTASGDGERKRYVVELKPRAGGMPINLTLGLAAGPEGILVGSKEAVEALAGKGGEGKGAKGKGKGKGEGKGESAGVLLMARTPLGDPLRLMGPATDALFKAADLPGGVVENIRLARFLLDQMHGQTVTVSGAGKDQLLVNLRWTTLHQRGEEGADAARALWIKALSARADGDLEKAKRLLGNLVKDHGETRFAARAKDERPGVLGALFTAVLATNALPAYRRYVMRSRQVEAYASLARLSMAARFSFRSPGVGPGGRALPPSFPKSTDWTPPKPCCDFSGGECQPAPGVWMTPTWKLLKFSQDRPHRLQYRFVNRGKVKGKASFSVQARGDLDCKGSPTLFSIEGVEGDDGTVSLSPMKTEPAKMP